MAGGIWLAVFAWVSLVTVGVAHYAQVENGSGGWNLISTARAAQSGGLLAEDKPKSGDDLLLGEDKPKPDDDLLLSEDKPKSSDDLLLGDDKPKSDSGLLTSGEDSEQRAKAPDTAAASAGASHAELFLEDRYPSANTCATCHPVHYEQWSVSQHAYAQLSPVYMAMQSTINAKTSTTNGDFCIRCHNQVGMNLGESLFISNLDRHPTSREGITCVVCHRVDKAYGMVSGRIALNEGDLFSPVFGPKGGQELERVLSEPQKYRVVTQRGESGREIHTEARKFFQLTTSAFCGTCHDVTLLNGFRLEEAFAEYQQSPAAKNGVTCQDCHMGTEPGKASGYAHGPAAVIGGVPTDSRKLTNHYFAGPDYSIIHPGIFPHNVEAAQFKSLREWLQFDYRAGWGTDSFEDTVSEDATFPSAWASVDDRYDAREILNTQFKRLEWARAQRLAVLKNGFALGDIHVEQAAGSGLSFSIDVRNATDGHGVPTGFDAERVIFLQVDVVNPAGDVVYQSGDRDPNGDLRDAHSLYVHNGELPLDKDLFNLQSKFVVRLLRGGEREQILAVNRSGGVLPFVRPETRATTIYGRTRGARKHKKTIEALGSRTARYKVDGARLNGAGTYQIRVKLIAQMVPVNLIHAIQGVGFDYGMSPREIADAVTAGAEVIWERSASVTLPGG